MLCRALTKSIKLTGRELKFATHVYNGNIAKAEKYHAKLKNSSGKDMLNFKEGVNTIVVVRDEGADFETFGDTDGAYLRFCAQEQAHVDKRERILNALKYYEEL